MKKILVYYKLVLLTSIAVVVATMCSFAIMFKNFISSSVTSWTLLFSMMPVIATLTLIILDATYISTCRSYDGTYLGEYRLSFVKKGKSNRFQRMTEDVVKIIALILIVLSIIVLIFAISQPMIEGIISYSLLLIVGVSHLYMANKKI